MFTWLQNRLTGRKAGATTIKDRPNRGLSRVVHPSLGGAVGYNFGPVSNLRGVASNANLGLGIGVGGGVTTSYTDGQISGWAGSLGFRGIPGIPGATASMTKNTTCTFGLSNLFSGFSQALCH